MDDTIYEDRPTPDVWIRIIMLLPAAILLIMAFERYRNGDVAITLYLASGSILLSVIMPLLIPRKYCILESGIRIVLGGPMAFTIPFRKVTAVRPARVTTLGVNFPANFKQSHTLEIVRRGALPVTITPDDDAAFIENFDKVFRQWKEYGEKPK